MRVSLLQVLLNSKSRAANMQSLGEAIDRAANEAPAPNLLVLPGACDTGGAAPSSSLTPAAIDGVTELLSCKAREWGVFLAAGVHAETAGEFHPLALLLDPDGDVVAQSQAASPLADGVGRTCSIWSGDIGGMVVVEPTGIAVTDLAGLEELQSALVVLPVGTKMTASRRRKLEAVWSSSFAEPADEQRIYWAVVSAAAGRQRSAHTGNPLTFVRDSRGRILAACDGAQEQAVSVDVPLSVSTSTARDGCV